MKTEHWIDKNGTSDTLVPVETPEDLKNKEIILQACRDIGEDPVLCCVIEAENWDEAREKFHKHSDELFSS